MKDGRSVVTSSIDIDYQNAIIVEYLILKVNLEVSSRKRNIPYANIEYVLKKDDFFEYKNYSKSKHISLLNKWMYKRIKKIDFITFEADLSI